MCYIHFLLYKCVALASARHGISMQIYEIKLAKWLENLSDIGLSQIKVQRPDVKSRKCRLNDYL